MPGRDGVVRVIPYVVLVVLVRVIGCPFHVAGSVFSLDVAFRVIVRDLFVWVRVSSKSGFLELEER